MATKLKVKLLVSRAGVRFSQNRGDEIIVSIEEGSNMIQASQAEFVEEISDEPAPPKTKSKKK